MNSTSPLSDAEIRSQFAAQRQGGKRAKDAAEAMGISEGLAVAAHLSVLQGGPAVQAGPATGPQATRLRGDWLDLLKALEPCGPVLALTRNPSTVHEKTGVYRQVSGNAAMGLVLAGDIDLRLFFKRWHAGFAVTELAANPGNRVQPSLQFFDAHGTAVHKIFVREATQLVAWHAVIADFTAAEQVMPAFTPPAPPAAVQPDTAIDASGLLADWAALQDTHDFFALLNRHGAERQQSFRLAQGVHTQPLATSAIDALLQNAALDATPIMCFVDSPGCIQIHSGPVHRVEPRDIRGERWLNVIDPSFNLHLREDDIAHVWRVSKPTVDGTVTSVEAFDAQGELIVRFFGARKPGQPELQAWRDLVAQLPE